MAEISIIIPTFNRSNFLGETLDSISAQTFRDWECIVIDDGSTDFTAELMEFYTQKDQRFKYYKRPVDLRKGANACRNYGFELSKGEFINWFDSDDLMHPQKLELQLESLKISGLKFSICQSEVLNNPQNKSYANLKSDNPFSDYLKMKIMWLTQPPIWQKQFLRKQSFLFDEELDGAQEWEFHCRILSQVKDYAVLNKSLVYLRRHSASITYNSNNEHRDFHYFLARLKVFRNPAIQMKQQDTSYLESYLLNKFKAMIFHKNQFAYLAFTQFVITEKLFTRSAKLNAILAIYSFKLFNRGNLFLQKIIYSK